MDTGKDETTCHRGSGRGTSYSGYQFRKEEPHVKPFKNISKFSLRTKISSNSCFGTIYKLKIVAKNSACTLHENIYIYFFYRICFCFWSLRSLCPAVCDRILEPAFHFVSAHELRLQVRRLLFLWSAVYTKTLEPVCHFVSAH